MYHNLHFVVLLLRWEITQHDLFRSRLIEPEEGNILVPGRTFRGVS